MIYEIYLLAAVCVVMVPIAFMIGERMGFQSGRMKVYEDLQTGNYKVVPKKKED